MDEVLKEPQFQQALADVAAQSGRSQSDLLAEAQSALKEMQVRPGGITVAAWDRFSRWLARAYKLDVNAGEVQALKELNRDSSLIFLPNHRSYLDPLVLRSALEPAGFPPNNVLGGANLRLWPLSAIGQRNGIVFIRREFRDDPLYRAVLKAYLAHLIRTRQNLEWYIEGGRTRTGKLRPPKFGVLSYVIDAIAEYPEHDVKIVPTSIIYDQQHEVEAISAEEMGGTKAPESLSWVVSFARSQSRRLGKAYVRFGEPLSLGDALSLTEDDAGQPRPRLATAKLAIETCVRINDVTPVTPSALLTYALLDNGDRAITVAEGRRVLEPLLAYIHQRKLPVTGELRLARGGSLAEALERLIAEGVVTRFDAGTEPVFSIGTNHQHEAAFYRNTIIHFFIHRAITELALRQTAEDRPQDVARATWLNARRLKEILKFEFFFPTTRRFADALATELTIVAPDWQERTFTPDEVEQELRDLDLHLAHRVVGPFLEAYSVLADELESVNPNVPLRRDEFVSRCLNVARQRWLQKLLHSPESVSKDYFLNAFALADNFGLLDREAPDVRQRRQAFAAELRALVRRTDELRLMAQASGQPVVTTVAPTWREDIDG